MKARLSSLAFHDRLRRLRVWQVLAVVVLCLGLVTCAKAAGTPTEPTAPPGPTEPTGPTEPEPPEPDEYPADQVELSLGAMIVALHNPESLVAPQADPNSVGADADLLEPCAMTSTGPDPTDGDGDNYPVDDTLTFDCVLIPESELFPLSFAGRGSLALKDEDDTDPASGVTAVANSVYTMSASAASEVAPVSITSQVSLDATAAPAGADYAIDFDGSMTTADLGTRSGVSNKYDATLTGSFQAGTMTVAGTLAISLQPTDCTQVDASMREQCQIAVANVEAANVDLTVTSTGLTYDTVACPTTVFTGGSFQASGAGNTITVSYGACGERTVTPVPPAGS